jgi:hypothetical protein
MLPKTHIIIGAVFSIILYFLFQIEIFYAVLIFLASFLIDFDHYAFYAKKKKNWSLGKAYLFLKKHEKKKPMMMEFHTIEFHILILLLGFLWNGFWFILIGMIFHSILDIISLTYNREIKLREYSLIRYVIIKRKNKNYYF